MQGADVFFRRLERGWRVEGCRKRRGFFTSVRGGGEESKGKVTENGGRTAGERGRRMVGGRREWGRGRRRTGEKREEDGR